MFRDAQKFKPTVIALVPALAELVLNFSKKTGVVLGGNLEYIVCGAASTPQYLIEEYNKLGVVLMQGYGLTESANFVSGNPKNLEKPSSAGLMMPNQEYKIVDGELWLRGDNMLIDYVDKDTDAYEHGWFKTGDLVKFDEDNFLYICGRKKDVIVLANGENISPEEVEDKFNALDIVQASLVYEDIDEKGKHILALEVFLRKELIMQESEEQMKKFVMEKLKKVNSSLLSYQRVQKITIRDKDFERTPSLKIRRTGYDTR